jgi:Flp pilus assembly protein TadG
LCFSDQVYPDATFYHYNMGQIIRDMTPMTTNFFSAAMVALMQAFRSAREGNVVITFAVALVPLAGVVGAAVDYSRANSIKAAMQDALDAAALNLVKDAGKLTNDQIASAATNLFTANFNRPEAMNVQVTAQYDPKTVMLLLNGSTAVKTAILAVVGIKQIPIGALSKAHGPGDSACVITLESTASDAFKVSGSGSVEVPNCGIYVNSASATALKQQGAGSINAQSIKVVGGATGRFSPAPKVSQPAVADPLASIPEPAIPGPCTYSDYDFKSAMTIPGGTVYCNRIRLEANITFGPGIHYFKGAQLEAKDSVNIVGQNAMLYFGASSTMTSSSSGKVSLTSPQSGTYRGIAIFGSRSGSMSTFTLTGTKDYFINGTIYLPKARLELYGSVDMTVKSKSGYVIAKQFYYQGDSSFSFDAFGGAVPSGLNPSYTALVQ